MHIEAKNHFKGFIDKYINTSAKKKYVFVEVGSMDINGSLRDVVNDHCSKKVNYIGLDLEAGKGVDKVMMPYNIPYENYADVLISSSQLEHDVRFWDTILQMKKAVKVGGLIYICAPSKGEVHRHPVDVYRFYPDAFPELAKSFGMTCLESYTDDMSYWGDNIAVFRK